MLKLLLEKTEKGHEQKKIEKKVTIPRQVPLAKAEGLASTPEGVRPKAP